MKSNKNKVSIVLCAVLCCVLILSGCGGGTTSEPLNPVYAPVDIRYIVENPLTITYAGEDIEASGTDFSGSYIQIDGLKNTEVQDKINGHLKGLYELYQPGEVPAEAREMYPELECSKQYTYVQYYGSFNNILSVHAYYTWSFGEATGERVPVYEGYYNADITYNVDLNTGNEFGLKDVFADNIDYHDIIGDLGDPMFFLYPYMLQVEGGSFGFIHTFDFDENFAITERFYDHDVNIYAGDKTGNKILWTYYDYDAAEEWYRDYTESGVEISLRGRYRSSFPEHALLSIKAEESVDASVIERLARILSETAPADAAAYYSKNVMTSRVQDFINVRIYEIADIYLERTGVRHLYERHETLRCYHISGGGPVPIRDIFIEGVNAEKILEEAVFSKLEADQQLREEFGEPRSMDVAAQSQGAADKFIGFCVNHESIFAEYHGDPALPSYVIELKYADLGFDNLTIFSRVN